MQELNEGNVYNVEGVFGTNLSPKQLGLKNFKTQMRSQLFDYLKRNKIQNPEEVIKKTFGDILEEIDHVGVESIDLGSGVVSGIGSYIQDPSNKTGAGVVIVTNPKGNAYNKPESSLGMGFALPTSILQNLQNFVNTYHGMENDERESEKFEKEREQETGEEDTHITWQKMNGAVANYLSQNLKGTLQQYGAYLPDEQYQQNSNSPTNTYHYDPYSRQVYRIGKFKGEQINK